MTEELIIKLVAEEVVTALDSYIGFVYMAMVVMGASITLSALGAAGIINAARKQVAEKDANGAFSSNPAPYYALDALLQVMVRILQFVVFVSVSGLLLILLLLAS